MEVKRSAKDSESDFVAIEKEVVGSQVISNSQSGRSIVASEEERRKEHVTPSAEVLLQESHDTSDGIPDSLHKAYAFLCHSTIDVIRDICVRWEMSSAGSKGYLVSKIMDLVHSQAVVQRAVSVSKILAEDAGWGFNIFLSDWAVIHNRAPKPPIGTLVAIAECKRGSTESKALLSKVPELHFQPGKKIKKRKFGFGSRKQGSSRRKTLRNDSDSTWTAMEKDKDVQQMHGGKKEDNDDSPAIDATGQEKCRKPKFSLREFVRLIYIIGMDADAGDAYGET